MYSCPYRSCCLRSNDLIKNGYCNCTVEAEKRSFVARLFNFESQGNIFVRCYIYPAETEMVPIPLIRQLYAVSLYARSFSAKAVIIIVRHLNRIIATSVFVRLQFHRCAYGYAVCVTFFTDIPHPCMQKQVRRFRLIYKLLSQRAVRRRPYR